MRGIFKMAYANIKKRKLQSILIFITILVSTVLLATSIGILDNSRNPVDKMIEEHKASQLILSLSNKNHNAYDVADWWTSQNAVENVNIYQTIQISGEIIHNGHSKSMGDWDLVEREDKDYDIDLISFVEGQKKTSPSNNEIWIPTGYSYAWNINLGDSVTLMLNSVPVDFEVAAIVVDPQYSSSIMNPIRVWVNEGTLSRYFEEEQLTEYFLGIRFSDYSQYNSLWIDFEEHLGTPFFGFVFDYDFIVYTYNFIQNIIALVIMIFSLIILAVAMFIVAFTIINGILNDYKNIGILKTNGFTGSNIRLIYIIQYLFLTLLALPAGLAVSRPLIGVFLNQMIRSLGIGRLSPSMGLIIVITTLVILSVVFAVTAFSTTKAAKIKPVEALRKNCSTKKVGKKSFQIRKLRLLPMSLIIGLKHIYQSKRHSIFISASSLVLVFVLVFSVNIYFTLSNLDKNLSYWGFDGGHVYINVNQKDDALAMDEFINLILEDKRVDSIIANDVQIDAAIGSVENVSSTNVIAFIYYGDMDKVGVMNIEGKNPVKNDEISLSYLVANKYGKKVGDTIDVYVLGAPIKAKITGIFQTISGGGNCIRIPFSIIQTIDSEYTMSSFSVRLKNDKDLSVFLNDINEEYNPVYLAVSVEDSGLLNIGEITAGMSMVALVLSLMFAIISSIIIFNFMLIDINNNKKDLGIYKAIGMTSSNIRTSLVWKVLLLSLFGIVVGVPLSLQLAPVFMSVAMVGMGIVSFPLNINVIGTLLTIPACLLINLLSVLLSTSNLKYVNLRQLIVD